jgi:hypothetical protein
MINEAGRKCCEHNNLTQDRNQWWAAWGQRPEILGFIRYIIVFFLLMKSPLAFQE